MTRYGTIPTSDDLPTSSAPSSTFFSRARAQTSAFASTLRPWRELVDLTTFSRPYSYVDAKVRARRNLAHFRSNYALITLIILFVGLIYHPISMIVFLLIFTLWLFLYFGNENPIVVLGREIDDRIVLGFLFLITILGLVFTSVGLNVLVCLVISALIIGVHASFRVHDDVYLDERESAQGGLHSVVSGHDFP
ncbi:PRA1 family protein F3-like protein [Carex littledalei]|uniref:PRA1 family protein n=1 Tax=Carex littledalei TaxID=544730 RepID=A0A833QL26_9POAL|nr:PRA1 family protein F3-like protein [Carex littledalei]